MDGIGLDGGNWDGDLGDEDLVDGWIWIIPFSSP